MTCLSLRVWNNPISSLQTLGGLTNRIFLLYLTQIQLTNCFIAWPFAVLFLAISNIFIIRLFIIVNIIILAIFLWTKLFVSIDSIFLQIGIQNALTGKVTNRLRHNININNVEFLLILFFFSLEIHLEWH